MLQTQLQGTYWDLIVSYSEYNEKIRHNQQFSIISFIVLVHSETGSGKTVCFAFPMLQELAKDPYGVFGLIITPSRELAIQIAQQFSLFGVTINLRISLIIGGMNQLNQISELNRIPHIVVATPGRLRYILEGYPQFHEYFQNIQYLVLDEVDRLVDDSLWDQIKVIQKYVPQKAQVILSTATLSNTIDKDKKLKKWLTKERLKKITKCDTMEEQLIPNTLIQVHLIIYSFLFVQKYLLFPKDVKIYYFVHLLRKYEDISCIVFMKSCIDCLHMSGILAELRIRNLSLNSMLSQRERLKNLQSFKRRKHNILLATDLASRGLDIPSVDLVINYDIPRAATTYIHRVGRTARQNKKGLSISLVTQFDVRLIQNIEDMIGEKLSLLKGIVEEEVLEDANVINKAKRTISFVFYLKYSYLLLLAIRK